MSDDVEGPCDGCKTVAPLKRWRKSRLCVVCWGRLKLPAPKATSNRWQEVGELRKAVFERSRGYCEAQCGTPISWTSMHMDHFHGRVRVPEDAENCWALCPSCDTYKTDGKVTPKHTQHWLRLFLVHSAKHGYAGQARDLAQALLARSEAGL